MIRRRRFLQSSLAATAAPYFLPSRAGAAAANGKLQHAAIGCANQGWSNLRALSSHRDLEVVALCDVDTANMAKAAKAFPEARRYQDYRELLASEGDRVDSVNISTPDHMHAPIGIAAMEAGKHVYCQKPLTHHVAEARAMREAAEKAGVVTQMGNQIQSFSEYKTAVRWVQEGVIGKITEIHGWLGGTSCVDGRPAGADPIPETLDWQKWLGVAPERPFKNGIYHPYKWRSWRDFGGGLLGDFGCHILDTPFKATGIQFPKRVRATVEPEWAEDERRFTESFPKWEVIEYEFRGTEWTAGDIKVTWYDGDGKQPGLELFDYADPSRRPPKNGALFIGDEGQMVLPHFSMPELLPRERMKGLELPREPQSSHYHSFVNACLGKGATGSSFDYSGPLTETVHLGRAAQEFHGQWLDWDAEAMRITNVEEANAPLHRQDRVGW